MALIWALFAALVVAGIVASGTNALMAVDKIAGAEFSAEGQARSVAEAGLVDTLAWFRRQQTQPVTVFAPKRDLAANPVVNETDNTAVGLLRDYEIAPSIWGRYEIRKGTAAEPYTDGNANGRYDFGEVFTDTNGNGVRDPAKETQDVSFDRGLVGAGGVWHVESHGTVYRRPSLALPLGTAPNNRIASVVVAADLRRLTIVPPAAAALCSKTGATINIGTRTRIVGTTKGGGVIYAGSTGLPVITSTEVTGNPAKGTIPGYTDTPDSVFGVSLSELRGMADSDYISSNSFPSRIGDYTLNTVPGPITFDVTRSLRGTGVVVVMGNCTIAAGSNAFFNGVLYVQGNLVMRGPTYFRGAIIVTGSVDIAGSGGDYAEMTYDGAIINEILVLLGQYRFSTAAYEPSPRLPDGTADEGGLILLQKTGRPLPGGNLPTALGASLKP